MAPRTARCAPRPGGDCALLVREFPVGWSQIARTIAADRGLDAWESARVLALVNLAMADGVIAGFDTKYQVNRWRPITAIRAGDTDGSEETWAIRRGRTF